MIRQRHGSLRKALLTIACQFASISVLTVSVWSTSGPIKRQDQVSLQDRARMRASVKEFETNLKLEDLKVLNKTRKFELVNIEKINEPGFQIQLTLKNGYDKSITAYSFGVGAIGPNAAADRAFSEIASESRILPGDTIIEYSGISLSGVHQLKDGSISIARDENLFITIYAVIFEDKTTDGDPKVIAQMLASRASDKKVVTLKNTLLQKLLDSRDLNLDSLTTPPETVLERLKSDWSALIEETVKTDNQFKEIPAIRLREELAYWLTDLDSVLRADRNISLRERLLEIKKAQEHILARL